MRIPFPSHDAGTVQFWRSVAPSYGVRVWRSAMARFAMQHGQAVAMLATDAALIATRCPTASGGVLWTEYPAHLVTWGATV